MHDEVLYEPFTDLRDGGLEAHLPVMCDFWETVLFRAALYKGSAMAVHKQLHAKYPLRSEHFVRWLTLWTQTVDAMYDGPRADKAVVQGARIAWAMNRHITGADDADLTALSAELAECSPDSKRGREGHVTSPLTRPSTRRNIGLAIIDRR